MTQAVYWHGMTLTWHWHGRGMAGAWDWHGTGMELAWDHRYAKRDLQKRYGVSRDQLESH
jgi:hypothetical protein